MEGCHFRTFTKNEVRTSTRSRESKVLFHKEQKECGKAATARRLNDLYALIAFSLVLELPSNNYGKSSLVSGAKLRPGGGGRSQAGDRPERWRRKNEAGRARAERTAPDS